MIARRWPRPRRSRYGSIDILCANAGIFPSAKLGEMTAADFEHVIRTNLTGTFLSVSAVLPAMKSNRAGRIVITSSITGPITGFAGLVPLWRFESRPTRLHAFGGT